MRFIVDAQLPPALARWLVAAGHEAEHVADLGMEAASDSALWEVATQIDAAIITKDEDFARRKSFSDGGPIVIWLRFPNVRRRELLLQFERLLPEILSALARGETLIEVV